jgi:TonB family protein
VAQPLPPAHKQPVQVAPSALRGRRISGEEQIVPPDDIKQQIRRDGNPALSATMEVCISAAGVVASVGVLASSGYPSYDERILDRMRSWRYQPYLVGGRAVPACSTVRFIYKQSN